MEYKGSYLEVHGQVTRAPSAVWYGALFERTSQTVRLFPARRSDKGRLGTKSSVKWIYRTV